MSGFMRMLPAQAAQPGDIQAPCTELLHGCLSQNNALRHCEQTVASVQTTADESG